MINKVVWSAEHLQQRLNDYFDRPIAIIIVSGSGFTHSTRDYAMSNPRMRLLEWTRSADDMELKTALLELLD